VAHAYLKKIAAHRIDVLLNVLFNTLATTKGTHMLLFLKTKQWLMETRPQTWIRQYVGTLFNFEVPSRPWSVTNSSDECNRIANVVSSYNCVGWQRSQTGVFDSPNNAASALRASETRLLKIAHLQFYDKYTRFTLLFFVLKVH